MRNTNLKGVPVRLAIGPRDVENGTLELARRDTLTKESISRDDVVSVVVDLMDEIQKNLYKKAADYRKDNTTEVNTYDEFKEIINTKGGFVLAHWDGTSLGVRTPGFHPGNRGSIPLLYIITKHLT